MEEISPNQIQKAINLRFVDRKKLKNTMSKLNKVIGDLQINNLLECNRVIRVFTDVVAEHLVITKK